MLSGAVHGRSGIDPGTEMNFFDEKMVISLIPGIRMIRLSCGDELPKYTGTFGFNVGLEGIFC